MIALSFISLSSLQKWPSMMKDNNDAKLSNLAFIFRAKNTNNPSVFWLQTKLPL